MLANVLAASNDFHSPLLVLLETISTEAAARFGSESCEKLQFTDPNSSIASLLPITQA